MKIAFVTNGNNVYDHRFVSKMVNRGHSPTVMSFWPAPVDFQADGVPFLHYDARFPRLPRIVLHLRQYLRRERPDVLHGGWVQTNGFYCALSGYHPMLLMPWGSDILLAAERSPWSRWVTRFTIRHSDMITCDCEQVKERIAKLGDYPKEKIVVFPWGIDLSTFRPGPDSAGIRKRLGWEGNQILIMNRKFAPVYGVNYFIEALPKVLREQPDTRVVLVGNGALEREYKARVAQLGIEEHVYFAGWVASEREMADYLRAADIYVSTSLSDGTSASLLEAMACGLPVVVSDLPANLEWIQEGVNGLLVPRRDSDTLSKSLIRLLKNASLRRQMQENNIACARERADWEVNFGKLESIYQLLNRSNAGVQASN